MDKAKAGEARSMVGAMTGKTTPVFFMAASERWECNKNGKRLRSGTSESASATGDCRSHME